MTRYPAYPTYKPSGVEWLGDVPEHWEVKRLKNVVSLNPETLAENCDPDYLITYIDISNVNSSGQVLESQQFRFEDAPSRARRIARHGDTIISTVRTYLRAIAFVENPPENLVVSTGFAVLRPKYRILPEYLNKLVQSDIWIEYVVSHSEGVGYPAINPNELAGLPIWIPPLSEQRQIATFLDRETARIDRLIARKERLIALLQERRSALISRAVTKGLNPDAPMKDSGVEWIGEIPAHWEVKRLKHITKVTGGGTPSKEKLEYWDGEIPWVSPKDMKADLISQAEDSITQLGLQESASSLIPPNRVLLVVRSGILKHTLPVGINTISVAINQDMKALSPVVSVGVWYLAWLLRGLSDQILLFCSSLGATVDSLEMKAVLDLQLPLPALGEQHQIADFVDRETTRIDNLVERIYLSIKNNREHRTALISAAVTGKIDVRGQVSEEANDGRNSSE